MFKFIIAYLLFLGPSPLRLFFPQFISLITTTKTQPKDLSHTFYFYFFNFFQAGRALAWFSLLVFRCGSGCQFKA